MSRLVLQFSDFVNEGYYDKLESTTQLSDLFRDKLSDIKFENAILEKISEIETVFTDLKTNPKYTINRESSMSKEHYAINAKIYAFPDNDEVRNRLKIQELTDDEISNMWAHYIYDQAEILTESINYAWVNDVSWAGKSGGWLIIVPKYSIIEAFEVLEDDIDSYVYYKQDELDAEAKTEIQTLLADPNFSDLFELRVVKLPEEFDRWQNRIDQVVYAIDSELDNAKSIRSGLNEIIAQIDRFRQNCVTWFYEMLVEEPDYALDSIHF